MVCRSLMLQLHRAGHIELPPVRWVNPNPLARRGAERQEADPGARGYNATVQQPVRDPAA